MIVWFFIKVSRNCCFLWLSNRLLRLLSSLSLISILEYYFFSTEWLKWIVIWKYCKQYSLFDPRNCSLSLRQWSWSKTNGPIHWAFTMRFLNFPFSLRPILTDTRGFILLGCCCFRQCWCMMHSGKELLHPLKVIQFLSRCLAKISSSN